MPIEVTMPRLSDTMEQGTIVSWNVVEGDEVSAGDVLGDIETDKATMELQNFEDGVVAAILLEEGGTVEVGKPIMLLAEEGEDPAEVKKNAAAGVASGGGGESSSGGGGDGADDGDGSAGSASDAEAPEEEVPTGGPAQDMAAHGGAGADAERREGGRIFASPLAKKMAKEMGVDLSGVKGSGPSGRIVRKDVESAAAASNGHAATAEPEREKAAGAPEREPAPALGEQVGGELADEHVKLSNMRATIAKRLKESKSEYPHYYVTVTVAMDELLSLRKQLNDQLAEQGVKLTVNDFIVRASALAMQSHPFVNASWGDDGQSIHLHGRVNIGVAIALSDRREGGLVVATIRDADKIGLRSISKQTKQLARKAREKGLTIDEMADASFTISNLGMYGVEHYTAIINPPNAAILAVGAAVEKPVVRDGSIVIGHEMRMTMSSDHRVIDGAMAADYLQTMKGYLEKPAALLV